MVALLKHRHKTPNMHITEGTWVIFKVVRPCVKRAKILCKEGPTVACIIDVLRGIYSWTGRQWTENGFGAVTGMSIIIHNAVHKG